VGTVIDVVVKMKNEYWFYEIKTALTPRACLREATGQLLEYGFGPEPSPGAGSIYRRGIESGSTMTEEIISVV
jgi:hypothetical protein